MKDEPLHIRQEALIAKLEENSFTLYYAFTNLSYLIISYYSNMNLANYVVQ